MQPRTQPRLTSIPGKNNLNDKKMRRYIIHVTARFYWKGSESPVIGEPYRDFGES